MPSLQSDGFSNLSASGSAISHTSSGPTPVFGFIGTESRLVRCLLRLNRSDRPGVELLASLHSQCSSLPLIQFLRLLTVPVLIDAFPAQRFIAVVSVWALPLPSIPVFITYLVNRTKCCL